MANPWRILFPALALLAACSGQPPRQAAPRTESSASAAPTQVPAPAASVSRGGYYKDDGPGERPPENIEAIPDALPRSEPLNRFANKPYAVFGRDYLPMPGLAQYRARGIASWYGRKFNGQKTSTGEIYDMYGMSAAHPTLPIPSYARVTNPANGKSVVVRVNDRGPFHADRLIDLSFTAAAKLGFVASGSALVEVERVFPGQARAGPAVDQPVLRVATSDAPAMLPESHDARGYFLQLGAFGNRDNAENLRSRLVLELDDFGDKLAVSLLRGVYRVNLGPWPDQAEARRVAERLRGAFALDAMVVVH